MIASDKIPIEDNLEINKIILPKKIEYSLLTKSQALKYGYNSTLSHPNYPTVSYYIYENIIRFSYFNISTSYDKFEKVIMLEN